MTDRVDLTDPITAIKAWCLAGTGLGQVFLVNEPRPDELPMHVQISVSASSRKGEDYLQSSDEGNYLLPIARCERVLSVLIGVESWSEDPADFALVPIERLRAFSLHKRLEQILALARVVLTDMTDATVADYVDEAAERYVSRYEMIATMTWAFDVHGDLSLDAKSWIEKVNATGSYTNSDTTATVAVDIHPED